MAVPLVAGFPERGVALAVCNPGVAPCAVADPEPEPVATVGVAPCASPVAFELDDVVAVASATFAHVDPALSPFTVSGLYGRTARSYMGIKPNKLSISCVPLRYARGSCAGLFVVDGRYGGNCGDVQLDEAVIADVVARGKEAKRQRGKERERQREKVEK